MEFGEHSREHTVVGILGAAVAIAGLSLNWFGFWGKFLWVFLGLYSVIVHIVAGGHLLAFLPLMYAVAWVGKRFSGQRDDQV